MSDDQPQISILDARLAEIDRRLRTIQTGLAADAGEPGRPGQGGGPADAGAGGRSLRITVPEPGAPHSPDAHPSVSARPVELAPPPPPPPPLPDDSADEDPGPVVAELRGLIAEHGRLLDAMGELLASGERILARAAEPVTQRTAVPAAAAGPPAAEVTLTAGPFPSIDAVRDFERSLGTLPGVATVQVRGYEGGDRAVVDVHLSGSTP